MTQHARTLAPQIAQYLDGFTAVPAKEYTDDIDKHDLIATGDRRLRLSSNGYQMHGRVEISPVMPRAADDMYWSLFFTRREIAQIGKLEITCRMDRGPAAIARDIQRRLLPQYLAALPEVRRRIAERNAELRHKDSMRAFFTEHFDAHAPADMHDRVTNGNGPGAWQITLSTDHVYKLTVQGLDIETAAEILTIYQQYKQQQQAAA